MAQNSIASELNDLLITHDFDVAALSTKTGKPAVNTRGVPDTSEADMFKFDWVGPTGKNYGTVVILLDQNGGMTMYFGDNLGRTMDPEDKKSWYGDSETNSPGFLEQLKHFAIRTSKIRGGFGLEDLSKLKYAIAGQAALTESFYGTKKVSYSGQPTEARLMIKHSRPITEGDKRYRYVESLFIETVEGECFRLPFRKLAGGRAMLEHVRQGGKPYDMRGQHIAETVNQLNVLSQFRRAHQGRVFEGAAGDLVTETDQYYQRLNHNLKHMASSRGYNRYFESWKPADISEGDIMVEDLRGMFVETRIDPRIESALPMLAKIQQEAKAMKEADIFESWAARLVEGTWALPDTPEKMTQLKTWLGQPQPLGPDAENVTDVLYDLIGDDALFDQLSAMAAEDPDADAVPLVQAWVTRNKDQSPELSELATSFQTAAPTAPPAPEAPAAAEAPPAPAAPAAPAPAAPAQPPVAEDLNTMRKLAGMSESMVDQSSDETMDDPDQDDKIANFQKIGQPMNAVVGSQRTTTDTGNGNPDFQERIASVTGPNGQGMYKVTVINNDDIASSYLTKNPPRNPQFFGKDIDEGEDDLVDIEPALHGLTREFDKFMKHGDRMERDPAYGNKWRKHYANIAAKERKRHGGDHPDHELYPDPEVDEGDNLQTFESLQRMRRLAGMPVNENVLTDHTRHTLKHILHTFRPDIKDWLQHGDMSEHLYDALYDYYEDDMPYGVRKAKALSRDPYEWIGDRLYQDLGDHGMLDENWTLPPADATPEEADAIMQKNQAQQDIVNKAAVWPTPAEPYTGPTSGGVPSNLPAGVNRLQVNKPTAPAVAQEPAPAPDPAAAPTTLQKHYQDNPLVRGLSPKRMEEEGNITVQKIRSPKIVQTQGIPRHDIKSFDFIDDPLPHSDLGSSRMAQGPDIALSMMDLDHSPVAGLDLTGDSEPLDECNYTMENHYCPVHGLKECWLEEMNQSFLETGSKLINDIDEADYDLGYKSNQSPFVDPRANYVMPANADEREQDLKDFGHITKHLNLGKPNSLVNRDVTHSTKTVPFGQNDRTTTGYDMPANAEERAADLKDFGQLTKKFNLGSNRAPTMEDRTFDAELARIKSLSSFK